MTLGNKLPSWLVLILEQAGGYYVILFIFMLAGALLGDILRVIHHFLGIFPAWIINHYAQVKLGYFLLVLISLISFSILGFFRFSRPGMVELNIRAGEYASHTLNMTIVAASDLHLGNVIRKDRLSKWVDMINKQNPDLVLLAGDIFDHSYKAVEIQKMDEELSGLKATYGVFAVPGNHDYYTGIDSIMKFLKKSGIKVLRDESVVINNKVVIIGRDDRTNVNRKPLAVLMDSSTNKLPVLVLDHQPQSIEESVKNMVDIHISGHTHNGQIFPFNKVVSKIYKHAYGYIKTGKTHIYVSSGLGLWGAPLRIGTQSEILIIHLNPEVNLAN
jgi:predicted MPP superfamily phosphohydrolase